MQYLFLSTQVGVVHHDYGFTISFDDSSYATGSSGNGQVSLDYNCSDVDEGQWDIPTVQMGFDDASDDMSGMVLCAAELANWVTNNSGFIQQEKSAWLSKQLGFIR